MIAFAFFLAAAVVAGIEAVLKRSLLAASVTLIAVGLAIQAN